MTTTARFEREPNKYETIDHFQYGKPTRKAAHTHLLVGEGTLSKILQNTYPDLNLVPFSEILTRSIIFLPSFIHTYTHTYLLTSCTNPQ